MIIAYFFAGMLFFPSQAADNTLMAFGNANMDDVIDQADITYVQGIIKGTTESTKLADANYDGKVDEDDVTQIEQIVSWDPDIILLKCHKNNPTSDTQYTIEMALSDPLFRDGGINAVDKGAVYYCMATCRGYPIERYIPETMYLAKIFHPKEFADLDLEKEGNEIMMKFFHEDGLFTWLADDKGYIRDIIEENHREGNW